MNKNKKPIRMIRNDQFKGLKKCFSSLAGLLTMVGLVLGFGFSELQAQDEPTAGFYNQIGEDVVNEITVEDGDSFSLIVGVDASVPLNSVNITLNFDPSVLQVAEDGIMNLAPAEFNIPLTSEFDNDAGEVIYERGYLDFTGGANPNPPASGQYSMVEVTFNVAEGVATQTTVISYDTEEVYLGTVETGLSVFNGTAPDFNVNVDGVVIAPDNDLCADAVPVICGETVSGSNVGASDTGAPTEQCGTTSPGDAGVWYSFSVDALSNVTVTTCNEATNYDTKLNVYSGSCEVLECVGGDDDGSPSGDNPDPACVVEETGSTFNRASTVEFEAAPGVDYYFYVSGFGSAEGNFDLTVSCEEILCTADAGTMTADETPVVIDGAPVTISATANGDAVVPEGFANAYVLTSGDDLVIQNLGAEPSFEVDMAGLYTIHSFVYDLNDEEAILDAIVFGETTGADALGLIEEAGLCASLDVAGAPIDVVPPPPANAVCEDAIALECNSTVMGNNENAFPLPQEIRDATNGGGTSNVGNALYYTLTVDELTLVSLETCIDDEEGNFITDFDTDLRVLTGDCESGFAGEQTFNPESSSAGYVDDFPIGQDEFDCESGEFPINFRAGGSFEAQAGVTYTIVVHGYGESDNGNFQLDVTCEPIVCFADAGTMTADETPVVLDGASVTISATANGDANVPEGFANAYVLTSGGDLVIQDLGEAPSFDVDMTGLYTIHSFVYDLEDEEALLDAVEFGVTTGGEVLGLIEELGLCASLDVDGAPIDVVPPPPANDDCENAEAIACGDVVEGSTLGATADEAPFCGTGDGSGGGVWYSFSVEEESNVVMSLCGSDYDTKLRVYTGSCDELECVAGDDDDECDDEFALQSTVPFVAEPGVEYLVLVHGFSGNEGNYVLNVSCESTCTAEGGSILYADGSETQTICLGEGTELDVNLEGEGGDENILFQWVITDADLNILGLPDGPPFNFDDAGEGNCLIWHLAFDPENSNVLEIAESENPNAGDIEGCFDLSNSLTVVREDCVPSDCDDYEYYLADILEDGTTNIYEIELSGSEAALSLKGTSEIEVHIALNEDNGMIYAVSKADGSYRTFDPETGEFGPVEMLDTEVSEIVGAAFNADGKLMILSQSENAIYSVDLDANEVTVFDSYSPSLGGDIDFGSDGALYLATREGFGTFYIAIPDEIAADILVGDAPQLVTGVADTEDENLIFSHRDATTLMVREYDGTPGTPYDVTLDGETFMTFNGDLASGCADNRMELDPCDEGGDCNAVTAVYVQGTLSGGGAIDPARANPNNSLGAPEGTDELVFTSLGFGGSLTFEFDGSVPNEDGDDITVVETTFSSPGCEDYPEFADVSVSVDGEDFFYIGTVCKSDNSVDISDAEVDFDCVNFVRVANNDGLSTQAGDGFDVDGIIAIHNCDSDDDGDGDGEEAAMIADENTNTLSSFPNPTNGLSQAVFVTGQTERATLEVYDMKGRLVEGLFSGMAEEGVEYRVDFDGLRLPNGVYMYRLTTDSETIVEKFMIAK